MKRILELDYLKGILILLVISFHLVYFEQLHPYAKQVVYAFHMPGFLLISGYLMNVGKAPKDFLRTLLWLAVPYIVMESGYIYMASLLPINEHIDHLTPAVFLDRLLLHPLGPYWYLHTLIICGSIYYLVFRYLQSGLLMRLILLGLIFYILTILPLKGVGGSFYFLAGAAIRQSGKDFITIFTPFKGNWGILSPIIFILLILPQWSIVNSQWSMVIVYFAISSLLFLYKITPPKGGRGGLFLGRNSLPLYVFSPIFTILCKRFVPYLQFDPTGLIFLLVSLVFCVSGSLAIAWAIDKTGISRYFFGRKAVN
ncbi:MAG: acyltransferase family protein [Bacteroidaceae bacterium]|nr:acyltransferase family protein [Bacteroidaceae bacterium]